MRGEILHHVSVVLKKTEIDAHAVKIDGFADGPAAHEVADFLHRGSVEERMVYGKDPFVRLCNFDELVCFLHARQCTGFSTRTSLPASKACRASS